MGLGEDKNLLKDAHHDTKRPEVSRNMSLKFQKFDDDFDDFDDDDDEDDDEDDDFGDD